MRLRGEVDDCVAALDGATGGIAVGDVGLDQLEAVVRKPLEVLPAPGVGELVEDADRVIGMVRQAQADVVGADEAGPSGDQELHAASTPLSSPPGSSDPSSQVTSSRGSSLSPVISSPS